MNAEPWDYTQPEPGDVRYLCTGCGQWRLGEWCHVCQRPLTGPASGRP